ncbi:MAG: hypothetical protein R2697_02160 [Ilumatobacteraceae bacterium]
MLVDSDAERHDGDPIFADGPNPDWSLDNVPGDTAGLDGRMEGVAGGTAFLLCRRASRLNRHAGQWALPGGRLDPGARRHSARRSARSTRIGLRLTPDSVVGWLDDYPTRSGYVISPVVLWGGADPRPPTVARRKCWPCTGSASTRCATTNHATSRSPRATGR